MLQAAVPTLDYMVVPIEVDLDALVKYGILRVGLRMTGYEGLDRQQKQTSKVGER